MRPRLRWRGLVLATVLGSMPPCAGTVAAQGSVRGVLRLTERAGTASHDLANAVIYLEPAEAGARVPLAPRTAQIAMRGRTYRPHVLPVPVGSTVAFPNEDPFSHNVFSNVALGPFDLGLYRRGETRSATFARSGVHPVYCNVHSKMVSFVVAVPTPWVAQPDADGRFVVSDVPYGRYVAHAWHERAATHAGVTVKVSAAAAGAASVELELDARGHVAETHLNKFGRPYSRLRADRY